MGEEEEARGGAWAEWEGLRCSGGRAGEKETSVLAMMGKQPGSRSRFGSVKAALVLVLVFRFGPSGPGLWPRIGSCLLLSSRDATSVKGTHFDEKLLPQNLSQYYHSFVNVLKIVFSEARTEDQRRLQYSVSLMDLSTLFICK